MTVPFKKLKDKIIVVIGYVLLISFGLLLSFMTRLQNDLVIGQAQEQARMLHHQLSLTRQWISDHQGLFVLKTGQAAENPSPDDAHIVTQHGVTLVKRNPAAAYTLVQEMGGTIRVDSRITGGTTLTVLIPVIDERWSEADPA